MSERGIPATDWIKGISYSVLASIIGGASKLAIRKSWLMIEHITDGPPETNEVRLHWEENGLTTKETLSTLSTLLESAGESETRPGVGSSSLGQNSQESSIETVDLAQQSNVNSLRAQSIALRGCGFIGMSFLNPLCCVIAMEYASPSVLAPFSGLTLIWVVMFSDMLIGEKPTSKQIFASLLIILGEIITSIFGDHTNEEYTTIAELEDSYKTPAFISFFVGFFLWMGTICIIIMNSSNKRLRMFAWSVSGGSITGLQNFLKDSLIIMKDAKKTGTAYPWFFYLFICLAMISAFVGLLLLTACMKRYDATFSAATFVGSFIISASIMSAIHYHTFQNLHTFQNYFLYPIGIFVLLTGVEILIADMAQSLENDSDCVAETNDEELSKGNEYRMFCSDNSDTNE